MNTKLLSLTFLSAAALAGCAGSPMRQYDGELQETVKLVKNGALPQAINKLEKNNEPGVTNQEKDILYYLEKGQLQTLDSQYLEASKSWLKADEFVREWEESVKTDPSKVVGDIGSFLVNDKTRRYDGQDYEKVMLSSNLTLSHLMQGNYDNARVEMKKTYEREDLIQSFREKEYDKLREDAQSKYISSDMKQLKGYPLAELDTPEVNILKNGYQNAFAHYLAGFFFEVTNEPSLAEPGYRRASELAPNSSLIQQGLREVGRRRPAPQDSDVLFVIESGFAPSWKSITVPVPLPRKKGVMVTPLSFPYLKSENKGIVPSSVVVAGSSFPVETLTNIDAMARRQLKDQMPSILLRTVVRAVLKSALQDQAYKANAVAGVLTNIATVATEQADDRSWRTLPEKISIARAIIPRGKQTIELVTETGAIRKEIEINHRFAVIPVRLSGGAVYIGQPSALGAGVTEVLSPVVEDIKQTAVPSSSKQTKKRQVKKNK